LRILTAERITRRGAQSAQVAANIEGAEARVEREAFEELFPASRRVHVAVGPGGSMEAFAALIATLGGNTIDSFTTEGAELSVALRHLLRDLAEHFAGPGHGPTFPMVPPVTPRTEKHGVLVALPGEHGLPPMSLEPYQLLGQTPETGISIIAYTPGTQMEGFAQSVIDLIRNDPHYKGRFDCDDIESGLVTVRPYTFTREHDERVVIIYPVTKDRYNEQRPSDRYLAIMRALLSSYAK
jgi:hypothetical protein